MDAIGIFALVAAVAALVKILTIIIEPKAWFNLTKKIWRTPNIVMIVCLVLGGIVFYNLMQELTMVDIFAVMLFFALIGGVSIASYHEEFLGVASKMLKDRRFLRRAWISLLIWLFLVLWALKELLI